MRITIPTIGDVRSALAQGHTYAGEGLLISPADIAVFHYLKAYFQWDQVEVGWLRAGSGVCLKCKAKETKALTYVYLNTMTLKHTPYWEYFCASAFLHFFGTLWDNNAKMGGFTDPFYIYLTTITQVSNSFFSHYDWSNIVRYDPDEGLLFESDFPYAAKLGTPRAYHICEPQLRADMIEVVSALGYGHFGLTAYSFDFVSEYIRGRELDVASYLLNLPEHRASLDQVHFDLSVFSAPLQSSLFKRVGNEYVLTRS